MVKEVMKDMDSTEDTGAIAMNMAAINTMETIMVGSITDTMVVISTTAEDTTEAITTVNTGITGSTTPTEVMAAEIATGINITNTIGIADGVTNVNGAGTDTIASTVTVDITANIMDIIDNTTVKATMGATMDAITEANTTETIVIMVDMAENITGANMAITAITHMEKSIMANMENTGIIDTTKPIVGNIK